MWRPLPPSIRCEMGFRCIEVCCVYCGRRRGPAVVWLAYASYAHRCRLLWLSLALWHMCTNMYTRVHAQIQAAAHFLRARIIAVTGDVGFWREKQTESDWKKKKKQCSVFMGVRAHLAVLRSRGMKPAAKSGREVKHETKYKYHNVKKKTFNYVIIKWELVKRTKYRIYKSLKWKMTGVS